MSTVTHTESYCHSQFDPSRMAVIHRITINGLITEILQVNRDGTSDDGTPWLVGMIRGTFTNDVTQSKLDELVPVPDYVKRSVFGWGHSFPDHADGTKVFFFSTHDQRDLDYKTFVEDVFERRNAIADHTPNLIDYPSPGSDWYRTFQTAWNDDIRDGEAKLIQIGTSETPALSEDSDPEDFPGIEDLDPAALQRFFKGKQHTFYKVTTADLRPPYETLKPVTFDPPKDDGTPGAWTKVHYPTEMCRHGIHITHEPFDWNGRMPGARIFEVEARGIQLPTDGSSKAVAATVRLTREVTDEYAKIRQEQEQQIRIERILQAGREAKIFVPQDAGVEFLQAFIANHRCPHCDGDLEGFELTFEEREVVYTKHTVTLDANGIGGERDDPDYTDSDSENYEYSYTCCGNNVEYYDFEDVLEFELAQNFQDFVQSILDDERYNY